MPKGLQRLSPPTAIAVTAKILPGRSAASAAGVTSSQGGGYTRHYPPPGQVLIRPHPFRLRAIAI